MIRPPLPLAALFLTAGLMFWLPAAAVAQPAMILHPSEVVRIAPMRLTETVRFSGTVAPSRQVDLSAQVSGIAEQVLVRAGDSVGEGQVLVQIATADLALQLEAQQASLESTRVQLESARAALERANMLSASGVASRTALDDAQSQVDALSASARSLDTQVRLAQSNLARATIRAPFAGIVSSRAVEEGQLVGAGTQVVSLVDLSTVTIEAVAPLVDTLDLAVGQSAILLPPGEGRAPLRATVERINPVAESGTRSIKFYLSLPNPDGFLRGGTFVTGTVELRVAEGELAVPRDALRTGPAGPEVLLVRDGRTLAQPVTTGPAWSSGALVQITGGLAPGDLVVAMALRGLDAGQSVTIED